MRISFWCLTRQNHFLGLMLDLATRAPGESGRCQTHVVGANPYLMLGNQHQGEFLCVKLLAMLVMFLFQNWYNWTPKAKKGEWWDAPGIN